MCLILFPLLENGEHAPSKVVREDETEHVCMRPSWPKTGSSRMLSKHDFPSFSCFSAGSLKMCPVKEERDGLVRRWERADVLETLLYLNTYQAFL